jgi:hypothetical protein
MVTLSSPSHPIQPFPIKPFPPLPTLSSCSHPTWPFPPYPAHPYPALPTLPSPSHPLASLVLDDLKKASYHMVQVHYTPRARLSSCTYILYRWNTPCQRLFRNSLELLSHHEMLTGNRSQVIKQAESITTPPPLPISTCH